MRSICTSTAVRDNVQRLLQAQADYLAQRLGLRRRLLFPLRNIQETFGLVPVEAMAAGLPVVVSDWNGYKETVRDGVDGFRIRP